MKLKINLFFLIGLIIPVVLVFRAFLLSGSLSWGDAPYFYSENLTELFNKPLTWNFRNDNFGNSQIHVLWLFIPTFLFGLLNNFFGLNSDILIRLIFYFPAVFLSFTGAWFFIRQYVKSPVAVFLGSMFYGFNNHFLMLVDGGQIGVALSYGIFPFVLLAFKKFIPSTNPKNFLIATFLLTLLSNVDLRIAVLSLFVFVTLTITEAIFKRSLIVILNSLIFLIPVIGGSILLNAFWIIPVVTSLQFGAMDKLSTTPNNLISLIDGFYVFNPHFPNNEFGQISTVPFYFGLIPWLIFGGLVFKIQRVNLGLVFTLLIMIFLSKGSGDPFGRIYSFFIDNIPFASAFRDSSKFFIASILLSATLISFTIQEIISFLQKRQKALFITFFFIYCYFLLLIWPAMLGNLSGVLAGRQFNNDFLLIYNHLKETPQFFRTVWFPEKPPLAFSTQGKESLSANLLYQELPFASMILGDYDLFYFLHDAQLSDWFKLLGIKYVFLPENERKKSWTDKDIQERAIFLQFVDNLPNFKKLDWGLSFPAYQVSSPNPKIFIQDKTIVVVGDTDIYNFLKNNSDNFSISSQGLIFLEDGLFDPGALKNLPRESVIFVFHKREKLDLAMSFLQNNFLASNQLKSNEWGLHKGNDYLKWRSLLFQNNIKTQDLAFGKEILFSSIAGERIKYHFSIDHSGKYYIAIRHIDSKDSKCLGVNFGQNKQFLLSPAREHFKWDLVGPIDMNKGMRNFEISNLGGVHAINTLAVVSEDEIAQVLERADALTGRFQTLNTANKKDIKILSNIISDLSNSKISYQQKNPTEYLIDYPGYQKPVWLVFSDHFDKGWRMIGEKEKSPLPFYSMINGFLIDQTYPSTFTLYYLPQDKVNLGLVISLVSLGFFLFGGLIVLTFKK